MIDLDRRSAYRAGNTFQLREGRMSKEKNSSKSEAKLPYNSPTLTKFGTMSEITHQAAGSFAGRPTS